MATPKLALHVLLEAKAGKEAEVQQMLDQILAYSKDEPGTLQWFSSHNGSTFGIFDTFADEDGRNAHLNGKGASLLVSRSGDLLTKPPAINKLNIAGVKL